MTEVKLLLFRKWDTSQIEIKDLGLQTHVYGRSALKIFNKGDVHIVERLANKLMHFGKKYAKNTGRQGGKKQHSLKIIEVAFLGRYVFFFKNTSISWSCSIHSTLALFDCKRTIKESISWEEKWVGKINKSIKVYV